MRTEQEMFNTILGIAQADNRVRAVYMSGSRANPAVEKDAYSDYDIVFVVTETQPFLDNATWLLAFGEPAIVQEPDSNQFGWGQDHDCSCSYSWLMLFADGNRIDLSIKTCDCALADYLSDTLCVKLLDKDQVLPDIPPASDVAYHIKPPTAQQYRGCCNEFWWCLNNVAKGIARGQMPYAHKMYMQTVHAELEKMMEWYIGAQHAFKISTGMWGKHFKKHLPDLLYKQYMATYADGDAENLWAAVFVACHLFRELANQVAQSLGYTYNARDDKAIMTYLQSTRAAPPL